MRLQRNEEQRFFVRKIIFLTEKFKREICSVNLWIVEIYTSRLGNLSIHLLLRDLRPAGSKERKIPYPNANPLSQLFNYVSCPNYTYEVASWVSFTILTQCLPGENLYKIERFNHSQIKILAALFTLAGFLQMKIWADGKHRAYKKEFPNYPKSRLPIIPFIC